ncbi:hypothetical protein PYW07_015601 [Mythimna separata]|uniref:Catalase core domain-containing protein n=1 Tax=Mythimna separata TaxID=271217 RepID=A0AAD7Z0C5_MYTSE|nr:hypothetical protein PYW07_015601 [Mythimna separata]
MPLDPVADQLIIFKKKTDGPVGTLKTSAGEPVEKKAATRTLNERSILNHHFLDGLSRFDRERIPERVAHAKAGGAFGYFEVTHDITDVCNADLFSRVGKRTPIAARFSPVVPERGGVDTSRDARGFALKFYTKEGNFDIAGLNLPIFSIKDPILFPSLVHAQKKNPATNVFDANMFWDFFTLHPETLFITLMVFGDPGVPDGYRYMPGFSVHTYHVVNKCGESYFVRFHFEPDEGRKNLFSKEAAQISCSDPDYATRDLYRAIGNGDFPSWTASLQVLSEWDIKNAGFDVFDVTKRLPLDRYPLRPFGRFVLNRNPVNYFAEIEQLAFCPSNLVPYILGAPDKLFESRQFSYRDTQHHRLGSNFFNIEVNYPIRSNVSSSSYNRDGDAPVLDNQRDLPNYYPNSFHGPEPYEDKNKVEIIKIYEDPPDNFDQAREYYECDMTPGEKKRLVENIVGSLITAAKFLQDRAVKMYGLIHPDLSQSIRDGLQMRKNKTQCDCD